MIHGFLYRLVCNIIYLILRIFYKIEVRGVENIPDGPAIIAPNHISYLDPPIVGSTCPKEIHYLANARLFRNSLFGRFIGYLNSHPVNTAANDTKALKMVIQLLQQGHKVLIFPEGTRSYNGKLQPLKLGCAMMSLHTDCPIIPVRIEGAYEIWPRHQKRPNRRGKLLVSYEKPIYPQTIEATSKKEAQALLTQELERRLRG